MKEFTKKKLTKKFMFIHARKGFTYLIVTTVIVAVLLSIFFATSRYKYQDEEASQQIRIRAMNDFMKNLNTDIHRATYISSSRALLALEDNLALKKIYLTNINESFRETFFNGTINGTSSATMANSTFNDYLTKVQALARSNGIILNITVTEIHLRQSNPWAIDVYALMNITAVDNKNTSSWIINKEYVTSVSILNLRDPLYSKNIQVPNRVRQLNTSILVTGNDTTNLQTLIAGSYYIASNYSPNFIMRFEGLNGPDSNGIESIVYIENLSAFTNSSTHDWAYYVKRTKVDFIFFNESAIESTRICNVAYIPSDAYFVIPEDRKAMYNITNLDYSTSCP